MVRRGDMDKAGGAQPAGTGYRRLPAVDSGTAFDAQAATTQGAQLARMVRWYTPAEVLKMATADNADLLLVDGANRYVIRFDKDATPPVQAFWSITMYDADSFFVANPLNRYAVSSWMPLRKNADGSLEIYVQAESPGADKESNWLPAPSSGPFNLTLRMYWPTEAPPSIVDGSWKPPAITRVH